MSAADAPAPGLRAGSGVSLPMQTPTLTGSQP
jgi:hypothetical protein